MTYFKMFRQPYLDAADDAGGGGGEDVILPDDFKADDIPPKDDEVKTDEVPPKTDEVKTEVQKIKVKFNHQEIEIPLDEATTHIQKGMNYEKGIEKARQEARDSMIAEQYKGRLWNGKPITTEAELIQATKEYEMREQYKELPEEVVNELIASKQFRDQYEAEQESKKSEAAKQKDQLDFLDWFRKENGREFDTVKDTIPQNVWDEVNKGKSLTDAFAKHENQQLKERIKNLEHNKKNEKKAPVGGVGTHGSEEEAEEDDFIKGFNSY